MSHERHDFAIRCQAPFDSRGTPRTVFHNGGRTGFVVSLWLSPNGLYSCGDGIYRVFYGGDQRPLFCEGVHRFVESTNTRICF